MKVTKKYKWMELSEGGLLREPKEQGPYYSKESLNEWDGFETEEDAIAKWEEFKECYKFGVPHELILISFYNLSLD